MKRITKVRLDLTLDLSIIVLMFVQRAAERILLGDNARFDPMFEPEDVCEFCVENSFNGDFPLFCLWWHSG